MVHGAETEEPRQELTWTVTIWKNQWKKENRRRGDDTINQNVHKVALSSRAGSQDIPASQGGNEGAFAGKSCFLGDLW